jgi:hypothetical protein
MRREGDGQGVEVDGVAGEAGQAHHGKPLVGAVAIAEALGPEIGIKWPNDLHRDGRISSSAKGTLYKGPFHLPRCLWYCWQRLEPAPAARA